MALMLRQEGEQGGDEPVRIAYRAIVVDVVHDDALSLLPAVRHPFADQREVRLGFFARHDEDRSGERPEIFAAYRHRRRRDGQRARAGVVGRLWCSGSAHRAAAGPFELLRDRRHNTVASLYAFNPLELDGPGDTASPFSPPANMPSQWLSAAMGPIPEVASRVVEDAAIRRISKARTIP
jgi:hypothetical protein